MPGWRTATLRLVATIADTQSPLTFTGQTQDWGGRQWRLDLASHALAPRWWQGPGLWLTVMTRLRLRTHTLTLAVPGRTRLGTAPGPATLVAWDGAANTVTLAGLAPAAADQVLPPDLIGIAGHLHQVLDAAAVTTGAGQLTVTIEPWLRVTPQLGLPVDLAAPTGRWRLDPASYDGGATSPPDRWSFGCTLVEDL